jgi:4-aminobutyrate aminotransferase-like enzyme
MFPNIRTGLPGPEAQKVLEKDQRFISQSYTRVYPLVVKRAGGVWVEDVDSNRFLDFTSGIAVCNTGHCHPKEKAVEERTKVIQACFRKVLLILGCGENAIRLTPPLIITKHDADTALTILEEVLQEIDR